MYQYLYDRAKKLFKKNACMTFYSVPRSLYMEMYAAGVSLGAGLLHIRDR